MADETTEINEIDLTKWKPFEGKGSTFGNFRAWLNSTLKTIINRINHPQNVLIGTYTGDGSQERKIEIGFEPVAVEIYASSGEQYTYDADRPVTPLSIMGGLAITDNPNSAFKIGGTDGFINGFTVYERKTGNSGIHTNTKGTKYYFIAYRNYEIKNFDNTAS